MNTCSTGTVMKRVMGNSSSLSSSAGMVQHQIRTRRNALTTTTARSLCGYFVGRQGLLSSSPSIASTTSALLENQQRSKHASLFNHSSDNLHQSFRLYSTTRAASSSKYAVIDHSSAYEDAMNGLHGKQLALAALEGIGKDDPPFDPFLEEELMLEREALALASEMEKDVDTKQEGEEEKAEAEGDIDDDEEADDEEEVDEEELFGTLYNNNGSLKRSKSQLATFRAGAPAGGKFAVLEIAGSQYKVTTDDVLIVNRLKPVDAWAVGSVHTLSAEHILLLGSTHMTFVGMPYVNAQGAEVDVLVEEITRDAKVVVFKKRRRKNSKRKNGFRRDITMLRILDIRFPEGSYQNHTHMERVAPDHNNDKNDNSDRKIETNVA